MTNTKDAVFTMVVPGLDKKEARQLKSELIAIKQKHAPNAIGSIAIGKKNRFQSIMHRCNKRITEGGSNR